MQEHMDWHTNPANKNKLGNYGERFLDFHGQFIAKFDVFRASKGLLPVNGWDPATPIPPALSHDHFLMAPRNTDNPAAVDPHCATPTWATEAGGTDPAPGYGYTSLIQFKSLDELGRAIDSGWHATVHNTIGGDMSQFHSPIDPVFWRWHRWVDNVRANWIAARARLRNIHEMEFVRILFGGVNDAPGVGFTPGGHRVPIPGGPGDPVWTILPQALRNIAAGIVLHQVTAMVDSEQLKTQLQKTASELTGPAGRAEFQ
jgi:hypothetical protein